MSVAVVQPRNVSTSIALNRDRVDVLDELGRGLGVSRSEAVCRLIDLHAGKALEEIAANPAPPFNAERARARKLTGELIVDVASLVREGMTKADAYRRVGVTDKVAARWEKRGRDDRDEEKSGLHADLVAALDQARAAFNHELIQEARRKGDYKTLLKLLDPEQFALPSRSEVDVTHRFQLLIDWDKLGLDETRTLATLLRKASPLEDDRAVTRTARPAIEAVPAEVLELVEEGEWSEAPALEAPALDEKPED